RADERPAVADDDDLADDRVRPDRVLEARGGDVLAARGDDDLLLAARDRHEAVLVDRPDVARLEPLAVEGLRRRRLVVPVLAEDADAADLELAVLAESHGVAGQRHADRADLALRRDVHRDRRRRLGEAPALEDLDAD